MKLSEVLPKLVEKFPASVHKKRKVPGGGTWYYIPHGLIVDRLNELVPDDWHTEYTLSHIEDGIPIYLCKLTICGVSKVGIGDKSNEQSNYGTVSQRAFRKAFTDAAEQFGICAYLDDQKSEKTKEDFIKYMYRSGDSTLAVEYQNEKQGKTTEKKSRPNQSKPFGRSPSPSPTPATPAPATAHPANPEAISDAQRKRFWAIATKTGFTEGGIKRLIEAWGFTSTKEITKNAYEGLCAKAEDPEMMEIYNSMAKALEAEAS